MSTTGPGVPEDPDDSGTRHSSAASSARRAYRVRHGGVAIGEVIVAAALVLAGVWAWERAVVPIDLPGVPASADAVSRLLGNWVALAVLAVTVAGVLVLDALRRGVLVRGPTARSGTAASALAAPGEA